MFVLRKLWQCLSSKHFPIFLTKNSLAPASILLLILVEILTGLQPLNAEETRRAISIERDRDSALNEILTVSLPEFKPSADYLLSQTTKETTDRERENIILAQEGDNVPEQIMVKDFDVVGSSVFSERELNKAIASYRDRPLTLPELFQARSVITKLYTDKGYVNSGAYIPPQELNDGTVKIAVLEGKLEGINVSGTQRLNSKYISSRIENAAGQPVNVESLLAALQLLRLDPLIDNVSAELSAGIQPGTSLLDIQVEEADVLNMSTSFNNQKSPSIGSNQRSVGFNHGNLLGLGDRFNFNFSNTEGSNSLDLSYGLPFNSKNGTIKASYGTNKNDVVEEDFNDLDIQSESRYFEFNLRQPVLLKPNKELALGASFSRSESETSLLNGEIPLSRGAEPDGETKITAIRLFQEYVNRDDRKVLAFRSQFSIGIDAFDPTINEDAPDSTFFAWRGQSQWVRRIDEDFLFLLRGDIQLSGSGLVPLEQFRVGGANSARGYRQDLSLGDNGVFASAELRVPILRFRQIDGLVQIAPFFDIGTLWNSDDLEIANATLPSIGLGLNFSMGSRFNARLDYGIPLKTVDTKGDSLQEDGVHFAIDYSFF